MSSVSRPRDTALPVRFTVKIDEYVFEAIRAGASGFLVKDAEPEDIVRAVRVVASGKALLSPGPTRRLLAEFASRPQRRIATAASLQVLTERERDVLTAIASGANNYEIADRLVISPATVVSQDIGMASLKT
jgi:DNA-binding NarL/FixJ family response regulator